MTVIDSMDKKGGIKNAGYSHDIAENKQDNFWELVTPTMLMKTHNLILRCHDVIENECS